MLNHFTEKKKKSGIRKMQMNKEETPFCAIQQEIIRVGSLPVKPLKAWKCMKLYTFRFH